MEVGLLIEVQYKLGGIGSQSNFIASSWQDSRRKVNICENFCKNKLKKNNIKCPVLTHLKSVQSSISNTDSKWSIYSIFSVSIDRKTWKSI